MGWWGLNLYRFLPPIFAASIALVVVASLIPGIAASLVPAWSAAGAALDSSARPRLALALLSGALVGLLPDRTWFLGDFLIRARSAATGSLAGLFEGYLPLDDLLHARLPHAISRAAGLAPLEVVRAIGAVEVVAFAGLAIACSRAIAAPGAPRFMATILILFGGYLTMFTGYAKPAREMTMWVLALACFGIRRVSAGGSAIPLAATMIAGLLTHRSMSLLIPVWLLIGWLWHRRRGELPAERPWITVVTFAAPIVVLLATLPSLLETLTGFDLRNHLMGPAARERGVLGAAFSGMHLLDLLDVMLVMSPVALPAALLARGEIPSWKSHPERIVPWALVISLIPLALFVHPAQAVFRDWDVFAALGISLSVLAAGIAGRALADSRHAWLAVPLTVLPFAFTLGWMIQFNDTARGLMRVEAFVREAPVRDERTRAITWDFLGSRAFQLGWLPRASDALEQAAELAPLRRLLLLRAVVETRLGHYEESRRIYRQLLERDADDPLGWLGLLGSAGYLGDPEELARATAKLEAYPPDGPQRREIRTYLRHFPEVVPRSR